MDAPLTKICNKCSVDKPYSEYTKRSKKSRDGHCHTCRACLKEYRKTLDYKDKYVKYGKRDYTNRKYGISLEEYNEKMSSATCEICGSTEGRMNLDHCHSTGTIRGCLCHKCNTALGLFDDNVDRMGEAINYLKRYKDAG